MDPKYLLGIYPKYVVRKANNEPIEPGAKYFVLRYDNDPDALYAATLWAARKGNWTLVDELRRQAKHTSSGEETDDIGIGEQHEPKSSGSNPRDTEEA